MHRIASWTILLWIFGSSTALPQSPELFEVDAISSTIEESNALFGNAVATSGDTLVVGARAMNDGALTSVGAAHVYRFQSNSWEFQVTLGPENGLAGDLFGWSVDVSGDTLAVGSAFADTLSSSNTGSVTLFRRVLEVWQLGQTLFLPGAPPLRFFGDAVSLHGETLLAGAPGNAVGTALNAGTAHVFRFDGTQWIEEETLFSPVPEASDFFGDAVAIFGNVVAVGARGEDQGTITDVGSVTIFRFDGTQWNEEQTLSPSSPQPGTEFGRSVDLQQDLLVVGATGTSVSGVPEAGSVSLFRFDGLQWVLEQTLTHTNPSAEDHFGRVVALDGDTLVAATEPVSAASPAGSRGVYRFDRRSTWQETQRLVASVPTLESQFGFDVAVGGNFAFVGAPAHDSVSEVDSGSLFQYQLETQAPFVRGDCSQNGSLGLEDAVCTLLFLFAGGGTTCRASLDMTNEGDLTISDAIQLLLFLFSGGQAPSPPFPACGQPAAPAGLTCDVYLGCL